MVQKKSRDSEHGFVLRVQGASENNLQNIDLEIPHDEFVTVTGLSGSGKSSLAFSTIYAEGQRRYIETFSPYTRQFFDKVKKPELLHIENVRPAIAIQQRTRVTSSRSTVGSMTDVNDYLKVLWANLARPFHPISGRELKRWTPSSTLKDLETLLGDGAEVVLICARIALDAKARIAKEQIERMRMLGFSRIFDTSTGSPVRLEKLEKPSDSSELIFVIDRLRNPISDKAQAIDSIEQAFRQTRGTCLAIVPENENTWMEYEYSSEYSSPDPQDELDIPVPLPRPGLFSFNSPIGACKECRGFGKILTVDENKVIPDPSLPLLEAIEPWNKNSRGELSKLEAFAEEEDIPFDVPWSKLKKAHKDLILYHSSRSFKGIYPWFKRLESKAYKMHVRVFLARFRSQVRCHVCDGGRLVPGAVLFRVHEKNLSEIWDTPVSELLPWLQEARQLVPHSRDMEEVFRSLSSRLEYLADLGLSYLTLGRESRTLSGGETQRVNLATALGSELVSTHFVLDEPSVGLHPRDTQRLLASIRKLTDLGNSVLVVEHDLECLDAADRIIEVGPEAGKDGGQIVFNGPADTWPGINERVHAVENAPIESKSAIEISNATARNLKGFDLRIPAHQFVCIGGPSGSGKSTLIDQVILEAANNKRYSSRAKENRVKGLDLFDEVLLVDQSGLAKSPRANIATYSKVWDVIREQLAAQEAARMRSLDRSSFSFNTDGGRCTECRGAGYIREDMQFLSDVYVPCELCLGKRFQDMVLQVKFLDRNASDWLETSIDECAEIFTDNAKVLRTVETLRQLGLGHLRLGHPLSELSGGEAQRLKLVPYIQRSHNTQALLIFDEPTTGLHLNDVHRLIELLRTLRDRGHSIICVEHNQELLLAADWIIDLGPEGGDEGGEIVLTGTPKDFLKKASAKKSLTAQFLSTYPSEKRELLKGERKVRRKSKPAKPQKAEPLRLKGAREHNLKDVSLEIPHDTFVAVTGVSGSGKSSIAKDIVYAEGQRRYLDCLSPYARQFIRELSKPDIDEIQNVRPTVCVYQHTFQPSKLSTLGTLSETYNFLRLLFSKLGDQYCPDHPGEVVRALSASEMAEELLKHGDKEIRLLATVINQKKGLHKSVFQRALSTDIDEVRVDGVFGKPSAYLDGLERNKTHSIEFVTAKFRPARVPKDLLVAAIQETFAVSGGTVIIQGKFGESVLSSERACPVCRRGFFRPDPEDLSFFSRRGRCLKCGGTGKTASGKLCSECDGTRLQASGRNVRIEGQNISELCDQTAPEIAQFLRDLSFGDSKQALISPIQRELLSRLDTLCELGLDYIPLNRGCRALSGGELQRLRLAAAMGTPLSGAMYIFDEPSAGLHPLDNAKVIDKLYSLKDRRNSVLLIEHDLESIFASEHILEVGPGGGTRGGEITYNGSRGSYPSDGILFQQTEDPSKLELLSGYLRVEEGTCNNIEDLSLELPLHGVIAVAGVSGAGKSSLVEGVILHALEHGKTKDDRNFDSARGQVSVSEGIDRVCVVDQKPIGKNSRSTPASYLKIWDSIRKLFAESIEAKSRGWGPGFFSYNSGDGRCPQCKGLGREKLEMSFLSEAHTECDLCQGRRYRDETLTVQYLGKNISEVLSLTFEEAAEVFVNHPKVHRSLHFACELGLGYLTLGQSSTTLSGGESQRIKLVSELARRGDGHSLYVLDEPTIGLHRQDVFKLLRVLQELARKGNTVLLIEHDEDILRCVDHLVELGPGPGEQGGKVIFEGPPKKLARRKTPWGKLFAARNSKSQKSA